MRVAKIVVFILCLAPAVWMSWQLTNALLGQSHGLGANPIEALSHLTGSWTLRLLLLTLCVTPVHWVLPQWGVLRLRRMLGLYAFFYALLHFLTYLVLDQFFDWDEIGKDIIKRPYITVGFVSFVLLWPLALSSNRWSMRKLGAKWKALHRFVYVIATGGVIHYLWLVKADLLEPGVYAALVISLLLLRLYETPLRNVNAR